MNKLGKTLASKPRILEALSVKIDLSCRTGIIIDGRTYWYIATRHQTFKEESKELWTAGYITSRDLNLLKTEPNVFSYVTNQATGRKFLVDVKAAEKYISAGKVPSHYKYETMYCIQDLPASTYIEL